MNCNRLAMTPALTLTPQPAPAALDSFAAEAVRAKVGPTSQSSCMRFAGGESLLVVHWVQPRGTCSEGHGCEPRRPFPTLATVRRGRACPTGHSSKRCMEAAIRTFACASTSRWPKASHLRPCSAPAPPSLAPTPAPRSQPSAPAPLQLQQLCTTQHVSRLAAAWGGSHRRRAACPGRACGSPRFPTRQRPAPSETCTGCR